MFSNNSMRVAKRDYHDLSDYQYWDYSDRQGLKWQKYVVALIYLSNLFIQLLHDWLYLLHLSGIFVQTIVKYCLPSNHIN